jgi:apolipoprotein N-acyltransferase
LSAVFLGALTVLGFAPFNLYYLPILTLALLFWLWLDSTPKQAFRIGLGFGLGEMAFGVSWLHISIDQFGNVGPVLAWAATALFVAFIAVFFALSGGLARRLSGRALTQAVWIFPAVWGLFEWLRGWILTGFPWLSLGYAQMDSPLSGFAPLLGVYGVGWLSALLAGLILGVFLPGGRFACALASCGVLIAGAALSKQEWTAPMGKPIKVSLIQANIPQQQKWLPSMRLPTLALYSRLTRQQQQSDLVIWPETAVPDYLHRVNDLYLRPLARQMAQRGAHLLLGVPVLDLDNGRYYNAAVVAGRGEEAYFKRHLVPFGEFLPLQGLLRTLLDFMSIPMSDFAAGQSPRPLLRIGSMSAGISICYEDAFGDEVIEALPKAAYLVNMSNDAWFGDSLAPHQHLQMAQMRALESGRALLRATNTGISALIGHRGELLQASELFEQRVLSGDIQPRTGATPYVRFGNALAVGLMSLVLALLILGRVFSRLKAKFL